MQMEPQVLLDRDACLHPENLVIEDGGSGVTTSLQDPTALQQPVKKQTRQWAAWTHQEEESFFAALRQVGKNFEKITCRVQTKNKDQVRHYYYRLVRRMNKFLGPELCLDAKNSKDTNAAMLRWWSLLEKYSCKASKLHLKPRRFKLFVETLGNQLLKDRKKNVRKRPSPGENSSVITPSNISNQGRASVHDSRTVKAILVDTQNIQKLGAGKGSSIKRHVNIGINRGNYKSDSSTMKASRHRRKTVAASTAAYKKWEKAAIAGVSLVADAAEHLERTSTDKEVEHVQDIPAQNGSDYSEKDVPSLPNIQSSLKLKLQLFPIDECTRRALEMDNHNPHLELTLSTRKKISSVLEHLHRKWGDATVACGELMLFPYSAQKVNLAGYDKWTKDSTLSAADVYTQIGSPPVFRLRYGWLSQAGLESVTSQEPLPCTTSQNKHTSIVNEQIVDSTPKLSPPTYLEPEKLPDLCKDLCGSTTKMTLTTFLMMPSEMNGFASRADVNNSGSSVQASASLSDTRKSETGPIMQQYENHDDLRMQKAVSLSARQWADSLTNISVSDLLSEASRNEEANLIVSPHPGNADCLEQIPFSCDSFDAAIAAHIHKHQNQAGSQSPLVSHTASIWDAEETCDAFSFPKTGAFSEKVKNAENVFENSSPESFGEIAGLSVAKSDRAVEELSDAKEPLMDDHMDGDLTDKCQSDGHTSDSSTRDLNSLTDIYWPDSLGPLDLDVPSCRYRSDDLILSDSLGGLNRLIASSLDAFQNCSFFGAERKESATVEAGEIHFRPQNRH